MTIFDWDSGGSIPQEQLAIQKLIATPDGVHPWKGRCNFVDSNNVVVGFSKEQSCCEDASWVIASRLLVEDVLSEPRETAPADIDDFVFDPAFHRYEKPSCLDDGGVAIFRLVAPGGRELFLHLCNCQNGYYGHGFSMEINGRTIWEGSI